MNQKKKELFTACVLWATVFAMYWYTLSPSVGFIDSGELATVGATLGIAHPTGYPLFTMLARIFSMLPITDEIIVRMNLLSALCTSLAVVCFFYFVLELQDFGRKAVSSRPIIASTIASYMLAFSTTFWSQGVVVEVYSLHLLLIIFLLFSFAKAVNSGEIRWWYLFAFVTGLAFTNHLTTVLLSPALLYWYFVEHGINKEAIRKISRLVIPFAAGFSVYAYLPLRAAQHPLLNWGNPQTLENFWWHFTGKQFRVWMFSSSEVAKKQLEYFFSNLQYEFHFIVLILAMIGSLTMLFSERRKFVIVTILFVSCVAYSINYDIHDIDSYFLLAFISVTVFSAYGMEWIIRRFENRTSKTIVAAIIGSVAALQLYENYHAADQSRNYLVEDYTYTILNSLPPNAIVLSTQWDYFVAASYYFQRVKSIRSDVIVLDKELFRRSWYFPQCERMYPALMENSKEESDLFLHELYKFEHDVPYHFAAIESRYTALLKSFIDKNDTVAFYVTPEIEPQYTQGYLRIPEGFLFRLTNDTTYVSVQFPKIRYREFSKVDKYVQSLKMLMVNALKRREAYEKFYNNDSASALYAKKAAEIASNPSPKVINF
ncbi:MAG: DUF2723 domain-containing protein [Bacteroidota bacterium]